MIQLPLLYNIEEFANLVMDTRIPIKGLEFEL
jgi:hypothetical protein